MKLGAKFVEKSVLIETSDIYNCILKFYFCFDVFDLTEVF